MLLSLLALLWSTPRSETEPGIGRGAEKEAEGGLAGQVCPAGTGWAGAEGAALQRYLGSSPCPGAGQLLILVDSF